MWYLVKFKVNPNFFQMSQQDIQKPIIYVYLFIFKMGFNP